MCQATTLTCRYIHITQMKINFNEIFCQSLLIWFDTANEREGMGVNSYYVVTIVILD
jgi:hypothetical protein